MGKAVKVALLCRPFTVQTDDVEERVLKVAASVQARLDDLKARAGGLPELSLALLAALTIADDLDKERTRLASLRADVQARAERLRERLRSA